jgi:dipeptidyl aminopeptidase/acylaminoacyl peptidase
MRVRFCGLAALALLTSGFVRAQDGAVGSFEAHGDVGVTPIHGSASYDSAAGEYRVTGGGANMWSTADAFQFVWKRISGDINLQADVRWIGAGREDHRKAVLIVRQSLDAGSPYADVALHGDGLTSLQFRRSAGAQTEEVRAIAKAPARIRIERRGDRFTLYTANAGEEWKAGGTAEVALEAPVYVGLGVCSHNAGVLETAVFSHVSVETPKPAVRSKISVFDLETKSVEVVYEADRLFEAPNWSADGKYLVVNSGGSLFRIALSGMGGALEKIGTLAEYRLNNDHGFSKDGKWLAFSASSAASRRSQVYIAAADGSNAQLRTPASPSYFHGWSPDGRWLAFVGERDGNFDIFRLARKGGGEQRITSDAGYDDGPDYSPDGKWIYFNSNRSGSWDIWRMPAKGAGAGDRKAERVTSDELEDWFPHPSPDGKWLLFLSFPKGTKGHDARTEIEFRMIPLPGRRLEPAPVQVLTKLFGGQGTINVNSWSPDSKKFAFVSYELK